MENWENNRIAVITSVTNTTASKSGKNMFSAAIGMPAIGAILKKATSTTAATATADQVWSAVGGRSDSQGADLSDSLFIAAVMPITAGL
jgi:hypothetical protein